MQRPSKGTTAPQARLSSGKPAFSVRITGTISTTRSGRSTADLASIAADRNQEPLDAVYDLLLGGVDELHKLMVIFHAYSEDQQREAFAHKLCMPGSDATTLAPNGKLAESFFHGAYTWASWFWRLMVRDERLLSPEDAVFRLTGQPAERIGLSDRGVLREGARADVAIFDPGGAANDVPPETSMRVSVSERR